MRVPLRIPRLPRRPATGCPLFLRPLTAHYILSVGPRPRNLGSKSSDPPLLPSSAAQTKVITSLTTTSNNLIISACAGSGKTTTILWLALSAPERHFQVLVYNRRLRTETAARIKALGLSNIDVETYHSFGTRHYGATCYTDEGLKRIITSTAGNTPNALADVKADVVVLDEAQDITPVLKLFVDRVLADLPALPARRLVLLGDPRQALYGFQDADARFLTQAPRAPVFGAATSVPGWTAHSLPETNRLSAPIVAFINAQMQHSSQEPMRAVRAERGLPKPRYVVCDPAKHGADEIAQLLAAVDGRAQDVLVAAPTIGSRFSKIVAAVNAVALAGTPVSISSGDTSDREVDSRTTDGKLLVANYHQMKGIEREAVAVFGFDSAHRPDDLRHGPTNALHVAVTRPRTHLTLVHYATAKPLPFLSAATLAATADVVHRVPPEPREPRASPANPMRLVEQLANCRSDLLRCTALSKLELTNVAAPRPPRGAPASTITDVHGLLESVVDITGTAVPSLFQYAMHRRCNLISSDLQPTTLAESALFKTLCAARPEYAAHLAAVRARLASKTLTTADILFAANLRQTLASGLLPKLLAVPLDAYTWVDKRHTSAIASTLLAAGVPKKPDGLSFTRKLRLLRHGRSTVVGRPDICSTAKTAAATVAVWEVKYTSQLSAEAVLQVACYGALLAQLHPRKTVECKLVNARTGQVVGVGGDLGACLEVLEKGETGVERLEKIDDAGFLKAAEDGWKGYVGPVVLPEWH
ncbi:P-loop containing nucleoside triphosphate hydrolase protein [Geopyxis carbonaria]|nr:P-loop containing nucleoside triphosphate hydrolase protein [Geopyxis carbonaria]